jgi:leucyl aminopeptidase
VLLSPHLLPESAVKQGIEQGRIFAEATNLARELTDQPANKLTPGLFAEQAKEVAKRAGLAITIYEEAELKQMGWHTFLAVAKGSTEPPMLVVLSHQGAPESKEVLGLVGKGITFDSGGLQIKPDTSMEDMKTDMGGAAAVLGVMDAIGRLKVKANVIAVIPLCENMTDGNAMRPGDVLPSFSGKTIEITHTDAEGRLILADALSFALSLGATRLVDIATLTGAAIVALGHETTALMTNDADWARQVFRAAEQAGERMWELPLFSEYDALLESEWADVKNDNGRPAGAIQGGVFLKHFVEDTPWVHLDIAGTVDVRKEQGMYRAGATGVGVRTLIQLALNGVNAGETNTNLRTQGVLSQSAGK